MIGELFSESMIPDSLLLYAIGKFPENSILYMIRAGINKYKKGGLIKGFLKFRGKFHEALECIEPLIKLLPNSGLPYILRASVINDRATAFKECTRAIEIAQKNNGPELAAAYLLRGSTLWDSNHQREGIEDLNRVEELNPDDYDMYYNRGVLNKEN